jgi:hypothetical protein
MSLVRSWGQWMGSPLDHRGSVRPGHERRLSVRLRLRKVWWDVLVRGSAEAVRARARSSVMVVSCMLVVVGGELRVDGDERRLCRLKYEAFYGMRGSGIVD